MMARKISYGALGLLVVVAGLLIVGEWNLHRRSEEVCGFCSRHIHRQAGVIAEIDGKRHHVCCAHCAVTEGLQEHKPVKLIQVTDYNSGGKLDPAHAWYVDGSRIVACTHDMTRMDVMKRTENTMFDRCSPGTFAFATHDDADAFAAKNGGLVRSLGEMLAGVNAGEAKP
jgi:hypothetical protein